jgi:hypothetical protein
MQCFVRSPVLSSHSYAIPDTETIDVLELSRRIERSVCEHEMEVPGGSKAGVGVGVSIGAASYPAQGDTFDQIIVAADKAMYLTKAIHRQRARTLAGEPADALAGTPTNPAVPGADDPSITVEYSPADVAMIGVDCDLILELDDSHVVESIAIN